MKNNHFGIRFFVFLISFFVVACQNSVLIEAQADQQTFSSATVAKPKLSELQNESIRKLIENALEQTTLTKYYDPAYAVLAYPNGDVSIEKGVCSDVVVRAFRKAGIDLQKEVHEDMLANFSAYPKKWGLPKADSNIDHRRVPNLQTYFTRQNKSLKITDISDEYKPGDIVAWDLNGKGLTHIGIVSNIWNESSKRFLIIHNIGGGTQAEDRLFEWKIIGHYRYF